MKNILSIIPFVLLISFFAHSQEVNKGDDGLYYDTHGNLYSGTFSEWYENGSEKARMTLKNGKAHGNIYMYFPDGQLNEIRAYLSGVMHGEWVTWNEEGVKVARAEYFEGQKNGKWYVWDENGVLLYDMTYNKGNRYGTWKMYDNSGNLLSEKSFD